MLLRSIFLLLILVGIYFLAKAVASFINGMNQCRICAGQGYWRGTRDERNNCTACKGTGKSIKP